MASDAKADARALIRAKGLTGDELDVLVNGLREEAVTAEVDWNIAARRLAAAEAPAPQWPERVWCKFDPRGELCASTTVERTREAWTLPPDYTVHAALLIPDDGSRVVLSRETVREARWASSAAFLHTSAVTRALGLRAILDAALAAGKEGA